MKLESSRNDYRAFDLHATFSDVRTKPKIEVGLLMGIILDAARNRTGSPLTKKDGTLTATPERLNAHFAGQVDSEGEIGQVALSPDTGKKV